MTFLLVGPFCYCPSTALKLCRQNTRATQQLGQKSACDTSVSLTRFRIFRNERKQACNLESQVSPTHGNPTEVIHRTIVPLGAKLTTAHSEASQDLHQSFNSLLSSSDQRGLVVGISSAPESLIVLHTIRSSTPDFKDDLTNIAPYITDNAAAYIILKRQGGGTAADTARCVAVTYVPDKAPVRQKMLFASTRLTLVRELGETYSNFSRISIWELRLTKPGSGTEHFTSTLFATTKEELTADGWTRHEAHGSLSAPLTEEEQNLEGIRDAEAQESMGTGARKGGHIVEGGIKVALPVDAVEALKNLLSGGLDLVQLVSRKCFLAQSLIPHRTENRSYHRKYSPLFHPTCVCVSSKYSEPTFISVRATIFLLRLQVSDTSYPCHPLHLHVSCERVD